MYELTGEPVEFKSLFKYQIYTKVKRVKATLSKV